MAAAPWFCSFCWSVSLLFLEDALFSAPFHWCTSPLFDPGLATVTGALTLTCSELALLAADWSVLLSLLADWLCSTSWPEPPPQEPLPPRSLPTADPPWFCWFCWSVSLLLLEYALFSALLPWLTSPLFDLGLATVTGALTLF